MKGRVLLVGAASMAARIGDIAEYGKFTGDTVLEIKNEKPTPLNVMRGMDFNNRAERRSYGSGKKQRLKGLRP